MCKVKCHFLTAYVTVVHWKYYHILSYIFYYPFVTSCLYLENVITPDQISCYHIF